MRRSRRGYKRQNTGKSFFFYFIFCLILPVVGIYSGYHVARYAVLPAIMYEEKDYGEVSEPKVSSENVKKQPDNSNTPEKKVDEVKNNHEKYFLKEKNILGIQIGSFSSKENADIQLIELSQKGMVGRVIEKDNFKVVLGYASKRENIDKLLPMIREDFDEAFVLTQSLKAKEIPGEASDQDYFNKLNEVDGKIFNFIEKIQMDIINSEDNLDSENKEDIKSSVDEINILKESLGKINKSDKAQEFNLKYINLVQEFLNSNSQEIASKNIQKSILTFIDKYSKL